jgi:ATP-dependent Lhr-like helicase
VVPAEHAPPARWTGAPAFLGFDLMQAMRQLLVSDDIDARWSKRAADLLLSMRQERRYLRDELSPLLEDGEGITWWTYAGGRANVLLAKLVEAELGGRCVVRNTSITCKDEAAKSMTAVRGLVHRFAAEDRPNREDARHFARACAGRMRLSKFQPCLPDVLLDDFLADSLDVNAAHTAVRSACFQTTEL